MALKSSLFGHGAYVAALFFLPYACYASIAFWQNAHAELLVYTPAILQFPLYGLVFTYGKKPARVILVVLHALASAALFLRPFNEHFS